MNERIKELAKQADLPLIHGNFMTAAQEKFAELIIKECAELVDRAISDGGVDGRVVKEHFGVEE